MKTKKIKYIVFGTEQLLEKEVPITETCVDCARPAIAILHFPEPYKVQGSDLELYGDISICEEHLRNI